jgi:SAM-dependent methyltransferase
MILSEDFEAQMFKEWCALHRITILQFFSLEILSLIYNDYEAHACMGMPRVHLLSSGQWQQLLGDMRFNTMLDVGAGQGFVTETLLPFTKKMYATELGERMVSRLREKHFEAVKGDFSKEALFGQKKFDCISLLNLLDRCSFPKDMLSSACAHLNEGGILLIADPFPLKGHIRSHGLEFKQVQHMSQDQTMSWEASVAAFVEQICTDYGLMPKRITRTPYYIQDDSRSGVYVHDDAVLVFEKI